jgi:HD-GYP domain-containing protein (c-di-GMP phosphodiesterase class II)
MKRVNVSEFKPGDVAEADCYSDKGEMLFAKGTVITPRHIELLHRRFIVEVQIDIGTEEEELHSLLSKKIEKLEEIDFAQDAAVARPFPGLAKIKRGEEGFYQLNRTELTVSLDTALRQQRTADRPVGPALRDKAVEMTCRDRTADYKNEIAGAYRMALGEVNHILKALAAGAIIEGPAVADVVRRFVKVFVTDRNILLNISNIKQSGTDFFQYHALNVCLLAVNIAASYGYSEKQVIEIGMGALLHDVGMLLVPRDIVMKSGRLSQEEWYEVQKHPVLGLHLLEKIRRLPESILYVAYQTHERENKTGYPKQRGSHLIHRFAKIVQVADIYEAFTAPRPYRPAYIPYESMERIVKMTRQGLVNGEFVKAFLRYASLFPVGSLVELNDHRVGKVTRANGDSFAKPVVSIFTDTNGTMLLPSEVHEENLASNIETYISRALSPLSYKEIGVMDGF